MKIVIDARATSPHFPGIGRATLGLLGGLSEIDHAHHVAVLGYDSSPPPHHPIFHDARFDRITTRAAPLALGQQWQLPLVSRSLRPDIWHAPYYVRPFAAVPPTVVTVFDVIGRVVPGALSLRGRVIFELMMRLSLGNASQIITSSQATRADLMSFYGMSPDQITVIPLAADRHFVPQPRSAIDEARRRYTLPERYVLYVGSNKPHKNLTTLVAAFERVQTDVPLVIAGRWDARFDRPKQLARQLGIDRRVRFIHDIVEQDMPALLSGATTFVFPSLYEGFGLPPLEAMACGAPVIASNRSALPEVIGDAGLLVSPDARPLADAIQQVLDDRSIQERLRERGLERAQQFSWEHTARETLSVYERVARAASK